MDKYRRYTASNDNMMVNDEYERMWKEADVAYFKLVSGWIADDRTENLTYDEHNTRRPLYSVQSRHWMQADREAARKIFFTIKLP